MRRSDPITVAVAVLILGSAAIATRHETQDKARVTSCANNLKQLWIMQNQYVVHFGGPQKLLPSETGDAFWLKLSKPPIQMIGESLLDIYQCPVENADDEGCDYRGPAKDVNGYADEDPVGADVDGNHGEGRGGNVIQKSGDVRTVAADNGLWAKAAEKTTGGNKALPPKSQEASQETPKQRQALVQMAHLMIGTFLYREFLGEWPKTLSLLVDKPKDAKGWPEGGFLLEGKLPKDPWGHDFQYEPGEREPKIWTWGADGKEGGDGDNTDLSLKDLRKERSGGLSTAHLDANERNASSTLKTFATAQAWFRSGDADCNNMRDFWTGDVAGLYAIDNTSTGAGKPTPIKLIEISAALADLNATSGTLMNGNYSRTIRHFGVRSSKAGYWFRALIEDKQATANGGNGVYAQDTDGTGDLVHHTSKFGMCAVPEVHSVSGKKVFIINENNTMFWRDFGQDVLKVGEIPPRPTGVFDFNWPTDAELARDWHKVE